MCATVTESVGNLLLLSSEGCILSLPWKNAAEPNEASQSMDIELASNTALVQEKIRGQVKETLLRLPLISNTRTALEAERSSVGNAIAALRSVAEAIFASQMDRSEGNNDGFVIKVEWKLNDRKMARKIGEGTGDIEVVSELSLILPKATAVAIDVANKNSTLSLSWVHHVLITSEEPGKTGRAWSVSAPIDTGVKISSVVLPFIPSSLHPLYVRSWVEFHWGEEGFNEMFKIYGTKIDGTRPGACLSPTPPGKTFDVLDWPCGTKVDNAQASAARLLQPFSSRSTVQHTFTVNIMFPQSDDNKGMSINIVDDDTSLALLGDKAIKEAKGIFRTLLLVAGEKASVCCCPSSIPDLISKSQMVSTIYLVVSITCTNVSLAAAVRQAVVRRARTTGCHVKISERLSSNVLLDDDLHSMLSQGQLVEVYEALRQQ
eukprot:308983_1